MIRDTASGKIRKIIFHPKLILLIISSTDTQSDIHTKISGQFRKNLVFSLLCDLFLIAGNNHLLQDLIQIFLLQF